MRLNLVKLFRAGSSAPRRPTFRPQCEALEDRRLLATLPAGFGETLVASGLANPTAMTQSPDGRFFIALQAGDLRVYDPYGGGLQTTPYLSVTTTSVGERGLLGIAFDPSFFTNGYVYVYYTVPTAPIHNRISRFTQDPKDSSRALPGSEVLLLRLDNLSGATNHNGGAIRFGLDGMLYASVGENANTANAQNLNTLHGKILRINPVPGNTVPPDNPYTGVPNVRGEVFGRGVRNPFSMGVHPFYGWIYFNDVGSGGAGRREEVNSLYWDYYYYLGYHVGAGNYGWPQREGYTSAPNLVSPLFAYDPSYGGGNCSIVGGAFYATYTPQFPAEYTDQYFFGDLCGNWIHRYNPYDGSVTVFATGTTSQLVAMGVDIYEGSFYYLARGSTGRLYQVRYTGSGPGAPGGGSEQAPDDFVLDNLTEEHVTPAVLPAVTLTGSTAEQLAAQPAVDLIFARRDEASPPVFAPAVTHKTLPESDDVFVNWFPPH